MAKKKGKEAQAEAPVLVNDDPEVNCLFSRMVAIEKVKPNPDNYNVHPDEQIEMLAGVLRVNGWREAIVVSNRSGMVVKGHGRLQTAKFMKLKKVPVEFQDYRDEQSENADMISDNRIAQHSYADALGLGRLLKKLSAKSRETLGYRQEEIDLYLSAEYVAPVASDREFKVLETLKMTKDEKAIVARAVQRYCLRVSKEVDWGAALASICIEWEGGVAPVPPAAVLPPAPEPPPKVQPKDEASAQRLAAMMEDEPVLELASLPAAPPAFGKDYRVFKVKYVAGASVGGEDAFVIRPEEGEKGFYTVDPAVVKVARLAEVCTPRYDLKGEVVLKDKGLWLVSLEKA